MDSVDKKPFDGNFHPSVVGEPLKDRYDFYCPCGESLYLKPSLLMEMGLNRGGCTCPNCQTLLELEVNDTNDGANARPFKELKCV
jgi:hypothetical protein